MATKKIYIDLKSNDLNNESFSVDLYLNEHKIILPIRTPTIEFVFKTVATEYHHVLIGSDIAETTSNLLDVLQLFFSVVNYNTGAYLVSISYIEVNGMVELSMTSIAPSNAFGYWAMTISSNKIATYTETPCTTYFLNNINEPGAININSLPTGLYRLQNLNLGTELYPSIPKGFRFDYLNRGVVYFLKTFATSEFLYQLGAYSSIEESNLVISINNNQLSIIITGILGLNLFRYSFSIDGVNFQSSNIFEDVPFGVIQITILDSLGCKKTFEATNTGTTNGNTYEPYLYISESNSIRFVDRVENQNCGNYKNVFNTLSCEETTSPANTFIQLAQTCDNRKTQVLTSYDNLEVYAKTINDNTTTEIVATKIVNNISLEDKRDCIYFTYNDRLAILYTTGNIYAYGTTTILNTYSLNGNLPEYEEVGTWLETDYGVYHIENIAILDNGNKILLMNVNVLIPTQVNGQVQVIYNRETYNIWEFDIDFSLFENKTITIGVRAYQTITDINFPDKIKVSEKIQVKQRWERSKEITWSNSKNTDIYFYSGIQMQNRLNFVDINTQIQDGNVEVEKTDSEVISIDASNYNSVELEILYLSTGIIRKILLALKHDNLTIEKVPYTLVESPEITRLGKSNFYNLKAKLTEAGDVWNQGTANTQVIYSNVEMIGLQQGDLDLEYLRIL